MNKAAPLSKMERAKANALLRLVVMAACLLIWMVGFGALVMPSLREVGGAGTAFGNAARLFGVLVYAAVALLLYRALVRKIEGRRPDELSIDPGLRLGGIGIAFGTMLFTLVVGSLFAAGAGQYVGPGDGTRLLVAVAAAAMASVGEELLFRGVMFRIVEQAGGTLAALLVSALLFGLAHLATPGVTLATAMAIAIEAGLMLGLAYVVTRNLWLPIGIHFAWNFTQSGIFGITSSGQSTHGLLDVRFTGPDWLTGGTFGPEASVIAIAICIPVTIALALVARRRHQWMSPGLRLRLD